LTEGQLSFARTVVSRPISNAKTNNADLFLVSFVRAYFSQFAQRLPKLFGNIAILNVQIPKLCLSAWKRIATKSRRKHQPEHHIAQRSKKQQTGRRRDLA